MRSDHETVRDSQSGQAITAYCTALAHELGLTLEDVRWGCGLPRDHAQSPYNLCISILEPFAADAMFWLPCDAVQGYATGTTTAAVDTRIRDELEGLCSLHAQMALPSWRILATQGTGATAGVREGLRRGNPSR